MAGSIESLKFDVILEDKNFKTLIQQDIDLAERLNTTLAGVMQIKGTRQIISSTGVANAKNMVTYLEQIEDKIKNMPKGTFLVGDADKLNETLKLVNANLDKMIAKQKEGAAATKLNNSALLRTSTILQSLTQITGVAFSVVGLRRFLSSLIDITGQFEVQRMALRNMLQDIDGADKIFEDLYHFASESTYRFSELAKYAKQLAAFNIDQNNLLETTKMLGDVASGVGVSMDRLILAYGHVKSSGFLRGIQLRSFSQNGVPILDELAKMFSEVENRAVSLGEVFDKMTKREIPFEMVEEAFRRMTSEGGKFYKMQEVLAQTLSGQINILKGRWENLLAAIGQANSGVLKGAVSWMNNLVANMDNFGRLIRELVVGFSSYQVALIASVAITKGFAQALEVGVLASLKKIAVAIMANPFAVLATAVAAASVVIYGLIKSMSDVEKIQTSLAKSINSFNDAVGSEIGELDALYAKLKLAREGTEEYDAAKRAITTRFGPYIEQLRSEGVEVDNLATIYQNLATKIREANKEKFLESSLQDLSTQWSSAETNLRSSFNKTIAEMGKTLNKELTAVQKESLWRFVTGTVNDDNRLIVDSVVSNLEHSLRNTQKFVNPKNATSGPHYMASEQRQDASYLMRDIRGLAKEYQETSKTYADSVVAAHEAFDILEKGAGKADKKEKDELVYKVSAIVEGLQTADAEIEKIRNKARKGSITQAEKDKLDTLIKYREAQAKEYEDIMGVKYDKDTRGGARGESAAEKIVREKIADIKGDIAILEKFKSAYDKWEPVIGEDAAREWVFHNMGKDVSTLDTELEKLIADLRKLGKEGNDAADAFEARFGLDKASRAFREYQRQQKALQEYERAFAKFDKDWGTGATGLAGKAEKIHRDYNNEIKKIEHEWDEFKKAAVKANKEVTKSEEDLYNARKAANDAKLNDAIVGLADDIFKKQMFGYDLSDWSHKSLSDILAIKDALENLTIPEDVFDQLSPDELVLLITALDELKKKTLEGTVNPEVISKWGKNAKQVANYISKAADAMKRLASATNSESLEDTATALGAISQNLSAAAQGYEAAKSMGAGAYSWIGAVIGGVTDIVGQIADSVSAANEKMREMESTIRDIRTEAQSVRFNEMLSNGVDTVFGENFVRKVRDAVDALEELKKGLSALGDTQRAFFEWQKKLEIGNPTHGTVGMIDDIIAGLVTPEAGDMRFRTDHSFWSGDTFKTLSEIAEEFGLELRDVNENLNPDLLDKVLEKYGGLNEGAKDWLVGASEYAKQYAQALEQIEDATKDIFDNLASDMTDKFIDNFLQMGNAVDDLSDTFADLGDAILRSFLQSYIIEEILEDYKDQASDALKKYATGEMTPDDYAAWLDGFADNVQKESETLAPAINGLIAAFKDRGLMNIDEDTASSLGSGIKSITEDTANLLASYINAIRADVSIMRGLQEAGWRSVAAIAERVASPTLNDYLAQCAANTFDIAQSSQSILSELQSVIGSPGTSGMVVRVEYA